MDDQELIDTIRIWQDTYPSRAEQFDDTFVTEMESALDKFGELTQGQRQALENIIEKWRME